MKAEEDYSHGAQRLASATLGVSPGDEGLEQPSARRPARRVRRTRVLCGAGMAKYRLSDTESELSGFLAPDIDLQIWALDTRACLTRREDWFVLCTKATSPD